MYSHVGTCVTPAVVNPGTVVFLAALMYVHVHLSVGVSE